MVDSGEEQDSNFTKLYKQYIRNDAGRNKILESLKCSITFDDALLQSFPNRADFQREDFTHIGSGSYADVFRQEKECGIIFKLIRLLPEYLVDRIQATLSRSTKYMDAFSEFQISGALSKLNSGIFVKDCHYMCQMFPVVYKGFLTYGGLPSYFKLSADEKSARKCEDINADYFLSVPSENLMIVMEDCGQPMRDVIEDVHPFALLSIIKQIVVGFMIAETALEFEHRDLHSGNVLLQKCENQFISYQWRKKLIRVPCYGYRVKIIDTTFSRIRIKQKVHFTDLSHLFENFNDNSAELKMQDQCYEQMSQLIDHNWQSFFPKTNLIWAKYVIHKLLRSKPIHSPSEELQGQSAKVKDILNHYNRLMDKSNTSTECFNAIIKNLSLNDCVKIIVI